MAKKTATKNQRAKKPAPVSASDETPQATTRKAVADAFGVSVRAVGLWKNEGWWQDDLCIVDGVYQIDVIRRLRESARPAELSPDMQATRQKIRLAQEKAKLDKELLALEDAKDKRLERKGKLLEAEVWTEFAAEWTGMCYLAFDDISLELSRRTPPEFMSLVYVDPAIHGGNVKKMAPLQQIIEKHKDRLRKHLSEGSRRLNDETGKDK